MSRQLARQKERRTGLAVAHSVQTGYNEANSTGFDRGCQQMYLADLHIHSRFSRATSRDGDAPHLDFWARRKGIGLVGTGDFTHPAWREELKRHLEPAGPGFYRLK